MNIKTDDRHINSHIMKYYTSRSNIELEVLVNYVPIDKETFYWTIQFIVHKLDSPYTKSWLCLTDKNVRLSVVSKYICKFIAVNIDTNIGYNLTMKFIRQHFMSQMTKIHLSHLRSCEKTFKWKTSYT